LIYNSTTLPDFSNRRSRRSAVNAVIVCLSAVRDAQLRSLENVPLNLQNSDSYELGEHAVDALDEIIDLLSNVY